MAAINQGHALAEPDDQLGSNPAAHRPSDGVHLRQEASQLHLAGMPGPLPAGQLRLDALPHHAHRAAVHHGHGVIVVAPASGGNKSIPLSKLRAHSGMQMRMVVLSSAGRGSDRQRRVGHAPPLAWWGLRLYARRGMFASTSRHLTIDKTPADA